MRTVGRRRWGQARCRRFLQAVPMTESKTVGTLTERQRLAVADMLAVTSGSRRTASSAQVLVAVS